MTKKVEIDGETYIVSEDVDFDQLDTDNMIEKSRPIEVMVKNPYAGLTSIPSNENPQKKNVKLTKEKECPQITFTIQSNKHEYKFCGKYYLSEFTEHSLKYKIQMHFLEAMKFHHNILKSQIDSKNTNQGNFCTSILVNFSDGEKYECVFPKNVEGVSLYKIGRVKIYSKQFKQSKDTVYVDIDFETMHLE